MGIVFILCIISVHRNTAYLNSMADSLYTGIAGTERLCKYYGGTKRLGPNVLNDAISKRVDWVIYKGGTVNNELLSWARL